MLAESCGALTVNSGGTVNCNSNSSIGASFSLGGTLAMRVVRTNPSTLSNGRITKTAGSCSAGGTLTASGSALVGGEVFDLFDAPTFSGSNCTWTNLPSLGSGFNWWSGNLTTSGTIQVNLPPAVGAESAGAVQGRTTTLPVAMLLANDTSEAGESLSLTAVVSPTPGGGTASLGGGNIARPLSDGRGGTRLRNDQSRPDFRQPAQLQHHQSDAQWCEAVRGRSPRRLRRKWSCSVINSFSVAVVVANTNVAVGHRVNC